jgi:hypothetical protein
MAVAQSVLFPCRLGGTVLFFIEVYYLSLYVAFLFVLLFQMFSSLDNRYRTLFPFICYLPIRIPVPDVVIPG